MKRFQLTHAALCLTLMAAPALLPASAQQIDSHPELLPGDQFDAGSDPAALPGDQFDENDERLRDLIRKMCLDAADPGKCEVVNSRAKVDRKISPDITRKPTVTLGRGDEILPPGAAQKTPTRIADGLLSAAHEARVNGYNMAITSFAISSITDDRVVTQVSVTLERPKGADLSAPYKRSARINIAAEGVYRPVASKALSVEVPAGEVAAQQRKTLVFERGKLKAQNAHASPDAYDAQVYLSASATANLITDANADDSYRLFDLPS
ncbi:MAG: hypothetical protein ACRBEQ_05070 [Hyphomonas sp.]